MKRIKKRKKLRFESVQGAQLRDPVEQIFHIADSYLRATMYLTAQEPFKCLLAFVYKGGKSVILPKTETLSEMTITTDENTDVLVLQAGNFFAIVQPVLNEVYGYNSWIEPVGCNEGYFTQNMKKSLDVFTKDPNITEIPKRMKEFYEKSTEKATITS